MLLRAEGYVNIHLRDGFMFPRQKLTNFQSLYRRSVVFVLKMLLPIRLEVAWKQFATIFFLSGKQDVRNLGRAFTTFNFSCTRTDWGFSWSWFPESTFLTEPRTSAARGKRTTLFFTKFLLGFWSDFRAFFFFRDTQRQSFWRLLLDITCT